MASDIEVIGLMLVLLISGILMGFNVIERFGIDLGLGFDNISGIYSFVLVVVARLVGLILIALSIYVIYNIVRK